MDHMSNDLARYIIQIYEISKNSKSSYAIIDIVNFVKEIYRVIEPSHFTGSMVVFKELSDDEIFNSYKHDRFFDKGILNHNESSYIFQIRSNSEMPIVWKGEHNNIIIDQLKKRNDIISYFYCNRKEWFWVNSTEVPIKNSYSCPSIFALQYHSLYEALLDYKNNKVKYGSCELLKMCWESSDRIYLKNKPEMCMQKSLKEYLSIRLRGVDAVREYNLGASKPVDIRVFWKDANRAALIEMKWMGTSLKENGEIGTEYTNVRANDGMTQIKEYIDLSNTDSPSIITKGYLIVIDCRRKNISKEKTNKITIENGLYYADKNLTIKSDKSYWKSYPNIEEAIRMFAEPICG